MKPLIEIQLVQVQPGQSRSGRAGSECCHSPGDWRVRSVHSKEAGREYSAPKSFLHCDADAVSLGARQHPDSRSCKAGSGSPESLVRGMLPKGFPVNLGELPVSAAYWASVSAQPKLDQVPGDGGSPHKR